MSITHALENIKKEIESAEKELNILEGRKQSLMETLQNEYGVATIEDAKELLDSYKTKITTMESRIEAKEDTFLEKYKALKCQ